MSPDQRWDAFLAKIRERSDELLAEAVAGSAEFIDQPEFDQNALGVLWSAIRHRLIELRGKISDTWSERVMDLFTGPAQDRAQRRGEQLAEQLELDFERAEVRAWADVGRWIARRAAELRVTDAPCLRCGARHSVVGIRATYEWTCPSCRATATFQPSTFEYQLPGAADAIAKDRAFDAALALRGAEHDRDQRRAYWQIYLGAVAEVLPERAATLAADLARQVE